MGDIKKFGNKDGNIDAKAQHAILAAQGSVCCTKIKIEPVLPSNDTRLVPEYSATIQNKDAFI